MRLSHSVLAASLSLFLLAGCVQPPSVPSPSRTGVVKTQPQPGTPLAALSGITDQTKQQAAAALSTQLGMNLRAERTMRDAELLASGKLSTTASYGLLSESEEEPEDVASDAEVGASTEASGTASAEEDEEARERAEEEAEEAEEKAREAAEEAAEEAEEAAEEAAERAEEAAKAAWKKLSKAERKLLEQAFEDREAKLVAKLAKKLAKKAKAFQQAGAESVVAAADGGKDVNVTYTITDADGSRTVTVTRSFDADGTLIQATQTLNGTIKGVAIASKRSRTLNPDGSISILSETKLTVDGKVQEVRWEKTIGADGALTATGTITQADGSTVSLNASGTEGGAETIAATDASAGVSLKLEADAASGTATASVEAGADGTATFELDADEDDEDEDEDEAEEEDDDEDEDEKSEKVASDASDD